MLQDIAHPIATVDPDSADIADLEILQDIVGNARVVCLGEGDHGISEFSQLISRISRFLIQHMGFSAYVMESGFAEGLLVNDWIHGADGDLEVIAREGMTYRFGESKEMQAHVQWLRQWNASTANPINFYGMDLPGSSASPAPAVQACLARIPARAGDAELLALSDFGEQAQAAQHYAALSAEQRAELTGRFAELLDRASESGDPITIRCAKSVSSLDALLTGLATNPESGENPRDEFMAETVRWILQHEQRIIISAHNGHVQRNTLFGRPTLGSLLAPELGEDMIVLGTTYGAGPEVHITPRSPKPYDWDVSIVDRTPPSTSIESLLHSADLPLALFDLQKIPVELLKPVAGMLAQGNQFPVSDFPAAFDALVHVHTATFTPEVVERLRDDIAASRTGNQ